MEAEAVGIQAEISAVGITEKSPALAIERIKTEIEKVDALVAEILTQAKIDALPTAEDIAVRQDALRQNRENARRKRQTLAACRT